MRYKELISKMTLEEKASLLSGGSFWRTKAIERLNIPSITLADGPHGIRKQQNAEDHLGLHEGVPATCFPASATVANSWSKDLAEKLGVCLGKEAKTNGVNVLLGPGLNIKRNPLCGRNFEYFSEDPYLSGVMAAGYIKGIQSQGVAACPKHFAANNQEHLRMVSDSVVDERTLREIYLTGFEIAVRESNPKAIMSAYNKINGTYVHENKELLTDILVKEWGFHGMVVSDWGGSNDQIASIEAGAHLAMPVPGGDCDRKVVKAVKNGLLSEEVLDKRVDEYLSTIFWIQEQNDLQSNTFVDMQNQHDVAREAAEQSIVLLKNDEDILPIAINRKVAIIGDYAHKPRYQGAGSSLVNAAKLENTLDEIAFADLNVIGYCQGYHRSNKQDKGMVQKACGLAEKADVVLIYAGLNEISETEGVDRSHMSMPSNQIHLINKLAKVNENVVVVLSSGSVIEMPWLENCKAVLHGYLSGQAGASAMLNVITGKVCPGGKLAETYPVKYADVPNHNYYPGQESTAEYREGLFVGYRYYDTANVKVRFPFGFGLSYTTFEYYDLVLTDEQASFYIKNTGCAAGAEVAQLYVSKNSKKVYRPVKELKGFEKVYLQPGEAKKVCIPFNDITFRFFDTASRRYSVEHGQYKIMIGSSSRDIQLIENINIEWETDKSKNNTIMPENYFCADVLNVSDEAFEKLLGRKIPTSKWDTREPIGRNDTVAQLYYAKNSIARLVWKILTNIKKRSQKKGKPNLNILFIYQMPFRAIGKMTSQRVSMDMVDGLITVVNGHFFAGVTKIIVEFFANRKAVKEMKLKHKKVDGTS